MTVLLLLDRGVADTSTSGCLVSCLPKQLHAPLAGLGCVAVAECLTNQNRADVAGVVVFAKTLPATRHVHAQFRRRTVEKRYLAIIAGVPAETDFVVDAPIDRHPEDK